jgi:hypothetical protein
LFSFVLSLIVAASFTIRQSKTILARSGNGRLIADNLSKAGWSWGCISAIDSNGRTIWIADAHRGNGKRFVVHADEKLTAFLELEAAILTEQGQKPLPCHPSSFRAIHRKGFALCFLK